MRISPSSMPGRRLHQNTTVPGTLVAASRELCHPAGHSRMSLLSAAHRSRRFPLDLTVPRTAPTAPTPILQ